MRVETFLLIGPPSASRFCLTVKGVQGGFVKSRRGDGWVLVSESGVSRLVEDVVVIERVGFSPIPSEWTRG